MKRLSLMFFTFLCILSTNAQPNYKEYSIFYFKLDSLIIEAIKNKEINFYQSPIFYSNTPKYYSNLTYSKKNNFFTFSSSSGRLYITTKTDTILIKLPILLKDNFDRSQKLKIISIKNVIKLETGFYNFDAELIKSFLNNNKSCNLTENGHCEIFYFDLPKKEKLVINKDEFKYLKEIEIQEDE